MKASMQMMHRLSNYLGRQLKKLQLQVTAVWPETHAASLQQSPGSLAATVNAVLVEDSKSRSAPRKRGVHSRKDYWTT